MTDLLDNSRSSFYSRNPDFYVSEARTLLNSGFSNLWSESFWRVMPWLSPPSFKADRQCGYQPAGSTARHTEDNAPRSLLASHRLRIATTGQVITLPVTRSPSLAWHTNHDRPSSESTGDGNRLISMLAGQIVAINWNYWRAESLRVKRTVGLTDSRLTLEKPWGSTSCSQQWIQTPLWWTNWNLDLYE